jgi:hypothetical protein
VLLDSSASIGGGYALPDGWFSHCGAAIDRIGVERFPVAGGLLPGASSWLFYTNTDPRLPLPLYALTDFLVAVVGCVPVFMVRPLPPTIRFSGLLSSYKVAYAAFGGLTPVALPLFSRLSRLRGGSGRRTPGIGNLAAAAMPKRSASISLEPGLVETVCPYARASALPVL